MPDLLYVYGTLKPIARQRAGRPAHVRGNMWDNGAYPAVRLTEPGSGHLIAGIVFEVTPDNLAGFDAREGVAHDLYRRVKVRTLEGDEVWMYEGTGCLGSCSGDHWRLVAPGDDGIARWAAR